MKYDRAKILSTINDFRAGRITILDIQNPIWFPGNEDLLDVPLSNNFKLREYAVSILKRVGHGASIHNCPNIKIYRRLCTGLQSLSDRVRSVYPGFQIQITSGYRPPYVDRVIGGSGSGPHTRGWAADCTFSGIPGKSADEVRRGVAYEALKLGIKGIELIGDNASLHLDPVRSDWWIAKQVIVNGRFSYPLIDPNKELKPYKLSGL